VKRKSTVKRSSTINDNEDAESIVSDIDLENVDSKKTLIVDPRKRELLLMAKIHTMKEKMAKRE
jgi:hypothetical protein